MYFIKNLKMKINKNMIEVEIRAKIKSIDDVKSSLSDAKFIEKKKQVDRVFGHPKFLDKDTKIIEGGLSARIREVNDRVKLEFKEIKRHGGGFEIGSNLSNVEFGLKFLEKLGFDEAFTVSKIREVYEYQGFEICLDQVEQLGNFIEIEKMVNTEDEIQEVRKACIDLLNKISPEAEILDAKYGDMMQDIINKG